MRLHQKLLVPFFKSKDLKYFAMRNLQLENLGLIKIPLRYPRIFNGSYPIFANTLINMAKMTQFYETPNELRKFKTLNKCGLSILNLEKNLFHMIT